MASKIKRKRSSGETPPVDSATARPSRSTRQAVVLSSSEDEAVSSPAVIDLCEEEEESPLSHLFDPPAAAAHAAISPEFPSRVRRATAPAAAASARPKSKPAGAAPVRAKRFPYSHADLYEAFDLLDREHKGFLTLDDFAFAAIGVEGIDSSSDRVGDAFAALTKACDFSSHVTCDRFCSFAASIGLTSPVQ